LQISLDKPVFGNSANPVAAYAKVETETGVRSADPHRLILLLLEGARSAIATAQHAAEHNDAATRGMSVSKAIDIINNGLRASLDVEAGGDLAIQLASLYEYMCVRLLHANLRNDPAVLAEVSGLLSEIHEAWVGITPGTQAP
jgi:flagellar secretion chaperone FliS